MLKEDEILLGEISYSRYSLRSKSFRMRKRLLRPLPSTSLLSQVKNSLENQPVRWVTPLGLPVVQPYCKLGRHLVSLSLSLSIPSPPRMKTLKTYVQKRTFTHTQC
ncbi:hypothetical protein KSP40_PGU001889 [Platanthera guangdongensis]|uniref:DNA-directed RNA polymerase C-terminal domain-containing protein n=1 Tax=Platanthera guangdongensis TaxID=2320717 RepID=A0ABR2N2E7_9ASPA